ncbi:MAG: VOC family protein [Deltaproteobacteria bacterium]|nr:VOC family protein [Deltaproteobacteria bacterium]
MQKITPFLWFDKEAHEAAKFYCSVFKGKSKIISVTHYGAGGPGPAGTVMSVIFELHGQRFHALNGGPIFKHSEAFSLFVDCKTQKEIDTLWAKFTKDGEESQCGWLKDKYGISWQIVPSILGEVLNQKDKTKAQRAMKAMMGMRKLNIAELKAAVK